MLPIQLTTPSAVEAPAIERPVRLVVSDRLSSASYKAHRVEHTDRFTIVRLENDGFPELNLGTCSGEDRAQRFLDWWVANDRRVQVLLTLLAMKQVVSYSLVDLMIEAAQVC
jgi:hypothetical protein